MSMNKKTVLSVCNVAARLLAVCLVVAALVALVYTVTKETIASGERQRKEDAIRTIFPDTAGFEELDGIALEDGVNAIYRVKNKDNALIGYCVDYTGTSDYGGDVNMMVGASYEGRIVGLQIISHAETFIDRYTNDQGCYTGISLPYGADLSAGATMSYRAIRNAMVAVETLIGPYVETPENDAQIKPEEEEGETPAPLFTKGDVSQFFGDSVAFSVLNGVSDPSVIAACAVMDKNEAFVGHCVKYRAEGGHNGRVDLLMARSADGKVIGVQVLEHFENGMDPYVDQNNRFDLSKEVEAGATETYSAVRNAISAVEVLQLGGVV